VNISVFPTLALPKAEKAESMKETARKLLREVREGKFGVRMTMRF
jgi:hypothetical protein